ncbi:GNAT family N-acetyltransferase [Clostridium sp. D2Q-11]|uniref:GNAT family N-acetyltransferase n=1 Tax=Anaeromonas frigoriresistens TaxID=2683708 RepID=A0A942Z6F2_9FIRM|nr:GNAT family N-acetyltransferase [Anaeromonas frigoriresistens]MBS4537517.1 GNAT family N-acetyltransferase [Anaeromonas frigoriresistens]
MLDKSIPYFNIIMRRNAGIDIPEVKLPDGYYFSMYSIGDEEYWAEIETSVGEFDNISEAIEYFNDEYLPYSKELERRMIFIETESGEKVATSTIWWNYTGEKKDPSLNWIGVKPEYQGLGLGKAIVFQTLKRMLEVDGDEKVYLHTQTWSYKAIGIYLQAGFQFLKNETFGEYENDYSKALEILENKIRIDILDFRCI